MRRLFYFLYFSFPPPCQGYVSRMGLCDAVRVCMYDMRRALPADQVVIPFECQRILRATVLCSTVGRYDMISFLV